MKLHMIGKLAVLREMSISGVVTEKSHVGHGVYISS